MSDALPPTYVSREDYRRIVAERSGRFERIDGRIVPMAQERASHNRRKQAIWLALHSAALKARLPCEAFGDGMTVEVGEDHDLEPDAILRCGAPLPADATAIPDPLVVVEIPLLSTARSDLHRKLVDYFRLPTVQHYLVFAPDRPEVIHHRRSDIGPVHGVHTTGPLRLDPPGLTITLQDVYD